MKINPNVKAMLEALSSGTKAAFPFGPVDLLPGVVPEKTKVAMDEALAPVYGYLNQAFTGLGFPGYAYLSELTQRSEYRNMSERVAFEMTRKWIRLKSVSDQNKTEEIKVIERKLKEFKVRDLFRQAAVHDGFFGRGQLYVKIRGANKTQRELQSQLLLSKYKIAKGTLQGFKIVEPIVTFPYDYNSNDALADDYYVPRAWFVLGQRVHDSRLLTFVSRPLPDLLKPAYNFGGISMSQLAIESVNNWISTRDSVNRMISAYSTSGIKTNLGDVLSGGEGAEFLARMEIYTTGRDNHGVLALDKDSEEFFQYNVPLNGLDKLQAQAQEHMASVAHTPLIILLGISPTGLNASSEGELRTFYDYVHDMQECIFRANLEKVIKLIQLSEFQAIDDDITFDFEPLWQMDAEKLAQIRKSDADAGVEYMAAGVLSSLDERKRLAKDPQSGYEGLDVDEDIPEPNPELTKGKDPLLAKVEGLESGGGFP
jgi:hypothetical protein